MSRSTLVFTVFACTYISTFSIAADEKDNRVRWVNTSYNSTIEFVQGKQWVQRENSTNQISARLIETARTAEYIELSGFNFGVGRLTATRAEKRTGSKWEWVSNGHWDPTSPTTGSPTVLPSIARPSSTSPSSPLASTSPPSSEELLQIPPRTFPIDPPQSLTELMRASEKERAFRIVVCKRSIREALDSSRLSVEIVTSIMAATNGSKSIVGAASAKGVKLDLKQLGTLQAAESELKRLESTWFVTPILRQFTPHEVGVITNATVVRIFETGTFGVTSGNRPVIVELPTKEQIFIRSLPEKLVSNGKPLPTSADNGRMLYFITKGYRDIDDNGVTQRYLEAEQLDVSGLDQYLGDLASARQSASDPSIRAWNSSEGKKIHFGAFDSFADNHVLIRQADGNLLKVPIIKLSNSDQEFVRNELKKRRLETEGRGKTRRVAK